MADPLNIDPALLNPVDKDAVEHEEAPADVVETAEPAEGATHGLEIGSVAEEPKVRLPAMLQIGRAHV